MSVKDCCCDLTGCKSRWRRFFQVTLVVLFLALVVILIVGAVLRPTKPQFVLLDATVFAFNVTVPNFLTSTFQVTIRSNNPMDHVSIYYDRLIVFASYFDQQITLPARIPPTYQDTNRMNIWSPLVAGVSVPIAPFLGEQLQQDQAAGYLRVNFKMDGQLRWKVGTVVTGSYHIHVECPASIAVGNPNAGVIVSNNVVKYQLLQACSVSV